MHNRSSSKNKYVKYQIEQSFNCLSWCVLSFWALRKANVIRNYPECKAAAKVNWKKLGYSLATLPVKNTKGYSLEDFSDYNP